MLSPPPFFRPIKISLEEILFRSPFIIAQVWQLQCPFPPKKNNEESRYLKPRCFAVSPLNCFTTSHRTNSPKKAPTQRAFFLPDVVVVVVGPCGDAEEGEGEEEEDGVEGREHLQQVAERRQHVQLLPRQNLGGNQMKYIKCQSNEKIPTQVTFHEIYQNAEWGTSSANS